MTTNYSLFIGLILFLSACNSEPNALSRRELDNKKHTELSRIATAIDIHLINNERDSAIHKIKLLVHDSDREMPNGKSDFSSAEGWQDALNTITYRVYWEEKTKSYLDELKKR